MTPFYNIKKGHRIKVKIKTIPVHENNEIIATIENEFNILKEHLKYYKDRTMCDTPTNHNNRLVLEKVVPEIIDESPDEINFGIIFIDIDNFKSTNDTYGHAIGDNILKTFNKTLIVTLTAMILFCATVGKNF